MSGPSDRDVEPRYTQALTETSEAMLRAIVNAANDAIVSADAGGDIIQVNRAAEPRGQSFLKNSSIDNFDCE